jgi:nucleotide-binding universal stress UspA family protein
MTEICSGTRLERILLATDFSAVAEVAMAYAVGLAKHFSSTLEAAHGIDLSSADPTLDVLMEPTLEALRHSGQDKLQHLADGISGLSVKKKMIEGHRAANGIVMGARKASFRRTYIREGFTPAVLAQAGCPVLAVC